MQTFHSRVLGPVTIVLIPNPSYSPIPAIRFRPIAPTSCGPKLTGCPVMSRLTSGIEPDGLLSLPTN